MQKTIALLLKKLKLSTPLKIRLIGILLLTIYSTAANANDCLAIDALNKMDQQYEDALRVGNLNYLQQLLADDFIWVHNLAVQAETKQQLMARLKNPAEIPNARHSSETHIHKLDNTAVIRGISVVEKNNADGQSSRLIRYQFLRTYVKKQNHCQLLAVQTMKLSTNDAKD